MSCRISIEVTEHQHQQIKIMASLQNKTMKDFIIGNIFRESDRDEFNSATAKAIEEIQNDRNLNIYNSAKELFRKFKNNAGN